MASNKKRAIIGFKGVALAPVTTNSILAYQCDVAEPLPYAGTMSRTPKETTQDLNYDDTLYAQIRDISGEDVELRIAEMALEDIAKYGLGTYDEETNTVEADFNAVGNSYSVRCITDTVSQLPNYFKWRVFDLTGIRFDNFTTKGSSITVCEVIITGVFKRPELPTLKPYAITNLLDDKSNQAACEAFMSSGEEYPVVP